MATRCNIRVIEDEHREMWFYRHCDGYPSSVLPSLEPLMIRLRNGQLRANLSQFAGWLVVGGHYEYRDDDDESGMVFTDWKCGAYEPTTGQHGDIDYLYTLDLRTKTLTYDNLTGCECCE